MQVQLGAILARIAPGSRKPEHEAVVENFTISSPKLS
jgi:hypothetical protein